MRELNELDALAQKISSATGVPISEMVSKSRKRQAADARRLYVMYACERSEEFSLKEIGEVVSLDHTTVIYHRKTALNLLETDKKFRRMRDKVNQKLESGIEFDKIPQL